MITWGISANEHDAALAVIEDQEIVFASHSERYSHIKNDRNLHPDLIAEALEYGEPETICWYEKPFLKRTRKLWAGQYDEVLRQDGASYLKQYGITAPVSYSHHHESHAAAGFYTSPFDHAAIVVVDAIGEWDTISVWEGQGPALRPIWSQTYPHSLGLLYSAFTQRIGMKPNEEEYILMGMAAYGFPIHVEAIRNDFIVSKPAPHFKLKHNVHRGIRWWRNDLTEKDFPDIAASIQAITEEYLLSLIRWVRTRVNSENLVFMGGVALNCVANSNIALYGPFENIWVMPNPGDAGSSIGAVAAVQRQKLNWKTPYLGHDIARPHGFDIEGAVSALMMGEPIGVAIGRAEFGPRALGNRSLIADPRGPYAKDRVNRIKKRELFRPFAPIIMEEFAHEYFDMPVSSSPYMQFVAPVRDPEAFPAISHVDGTARVQTLSREQNPTFYRLLERFYGATGCPMLLNTSLNIKGQPLVNTWEDALEFQERYGVKMF